MGLPQALARSLSSVLLAPLLAGGAAGDGAPELSLPIACVPGESCFIQSYVDVDPGPGVKDYACGTATYEGHDGIDFRLNSAAETKTAVSVLAAADGTVKGGRDGMADAFVTPDSRAAIKGRECGNGVVIDHGQGWETQYCHMRKGSVRVHQGEKVARGQPLGDVGYSGLVEFAHLHFMVRHDGTVLDPFSGKAREGACADPREARGLWRADALSALPYKAGEILAVGFTGAMPDLHGLEVAHALPPPGAASDQLLLFARILNLRAGDRISLTISGPGGFSVTNTSDPLERNKASYLAYAGKRRTAAAWPPGRYEGTVALLRDGAPVSTRAASFELSQ